MRHRALLPPLAAAALLAACRSVSPGIHIENSGRLVVPPPPATARKDASDAATLSIDYAFRTYDGEALSARFQIPRSSYEADFASWGYRDADLYVLRYLRDAARWSAFKTANARGRSQAELDAELASIKTDYEWKFKEYLIARGFEIGQGDFVRADLASLVRRSAPLVAPLARSLERSAKGRGSEWLADAATSMVQTAIEYKEVPSVIGPVHTGGVLPPARTLAEGWGDCDTKVALLAAILANWPSSKMIVVELPDHFLLGLRREPRSRQSFVLFGGEKYILIEASGPAWLPPGYLGDETRALFESGSAYRVSPLF
jgi:hypothetical protein